MKTINFLMVFLFLSTFLHAQDENKTDAKGRKTGKWVVKHENGVTRYTGEFKEGKPVGDFKYYYETGDMKSLVKFRTDGKTSYATYYYSEEDGGKKMSEGKFIDQKKDSTWTYYDYGGIMTYTQEYKDDLEHGKKMIYYVSGEKSEEFTYVNGKKEGAWAQYFESGQRRKTGNYKEDVLWGRVSVYNGETKKVEQELLYKQGVLHGLSTAYDEDGKVKKEMYFNNGTLVDDSKVEEFKLILQKEKEEKAKTDNTKKDNTKTNTTKGNTTKTGTTKTTTGTTGTKSTDTKTTTTGTKSTTGTKAGTGTKTTTDAVKK